MSANDSSLCERLTKTEQRQTMSAQKKLKKKKKKGTVRPVLMNPLEKTPVKLGKRSSELSAIVSRELNALIKEPDKKSLARASLTIGVNETYQHLKKDNYIGGVLVASDIFPESLVSHVQMRCDARAVPVAKVANLREITKESLGFSCICLGLLIKDDKFKETIDFIVENCAKTVGTPLLIESTNEEERNSPIHKEPKRIFQYLKRDSNLARVFIPKTEDTVAHGTGFISIADQNFTSAASKGISMNLNKDRGDSRKRTFVGDLKDNWNIKKKKTNKNGEKNLPGDSVKVQSKKPKFIPAKVQKIASNPNRKGVQKLNKYLLKEKN